MNRHMIIPVYDAALLPEVDYQINVSPLTETEKSRLKIDRNKAILLPLKENRAKADIKAEDFFEYGVLADVKSVRNSGRGTFVQADSHQKVKVYDITFLDGIMEGYYSTEEEIPDITIKSERELLDSLKRTAIELSKNIQGGSMALSYIQSCATINEFAAVFSPFFDMTPAEKYEMLRTSSLKQRGLIIQDALLKFKSSIELQQDLNKRYQDTEGNVYKKQAIQKQMQLLQDELDEMDPETSHEENEYKRKIEASGMPQEARKEVDRVLKRFMQAQPNDPEKTSLENYLDFVTELKWKIEDTPEIDLKRARKVLDRDHYGLDKIKKRILQQIAVMTLKEKQSGFILLLVGAPGTGKTSMGRSIAESLDRKYVRISLGGVRDEAEIRGHRRTYVGAMPGRIMDGIKRSGAMNPVVILDEVDKLMAGGFSGDPQSALLEVLDPEQNNTFTDHYMNVPYDLSNVFFICTANTTDTIPQPLLDRMEVIHLSGYSPIEKFEIARKHLLPKAMEDAGITKDDLNITPGAIRKIIESYTMEAGVRGLKKQLDVLCRQTAAEFVENGKQKISIKDRDIEKYLGTMPIVHDRILKKSPAGVVTGLAWTQVGGEILFIESTMMKGSGKMTLTGQLGDVMKESATIALSLVKSMFASRDIDFDSTDIHIHVPAGAVPKDGPSAGVTMFTALVSLFTDTPVSPKLAMTGEISLRGQVLPIGGLPEKLMAADRAGVKTVLIPKDNMRNLEDVPEEVKKKLEIVPVENVQELIKKAMGINLPRKHSVNNEEN